MGGGHTVGHLKSWLNERFVKIVFHFLKGDNNNCCRIEVTRKGCNLGDGEGTQVPCLRHFEGKTFCTYRLRNKFLKLRADKVIYLDMHVGINIYQLFRLDYLSMCSHVFYLRLWKTDEHVIKTFLKIVKCSFTISSNRSIILKKM